MKTILCVDDEPSVRQSIKLVFAGAYRVLLAESVAEAVRIARAQRVDLVLLDLTLPESSGLEVLREFNERGRMTPVVVVTATTCVATAVEAMKYGARDYIVKPFDVGQLRATADRLLAGPGAARELRVFEAERPNVFPGIVGEAAALIAPLAKARQAMRVDSTVLITGESGTGKDLLAQAIHRGSARAGKPFVPLSCCAMPEQLLESELFGHVRGAFTGALEEYAGKLKAANGGVLFLDEIGEMALDGQAKLLRVLQDGAFFPVGATKLERVDLRIICATNRDLKQAVEAGAFREDLYYRINVLPIEMPPLRGRREDIPKLAAHFLAKHAPRVRAAAEGVSPRAIARLVGYAWPGNVRELENVIERALVAHPGEKVLRTAHFEGVLDDGPPADLEDFAGFEGLSLAEATRNLERHLILRALREANGVQSRAAEILGTTRRILKYKMDQLEIPGGEQSLAG